MTDRNIWVISDTHFNHADIIKFCDRPFETADEMNWAMVERWNSVVRPQDKVYHLGDVYMGGGFSRQYTENLFSKLNGHKRLILGNHDNGKDQILQRVFKKIDVWRMFPEFGLLLTHVPVHESTLGEGRFMDKKYLNIHGHIHQNKSPSKYHQCVCVEHINYTPVNIETLRVK
jgi:calcineurin-like phosphoesterase family protein